MAFYDEIEARVPNKSGFYRGYKNRMSLQFDYLYPTAFDEVLPNDTWQINQKNIARFAPMLTPAFADVKMYSHYYFVPRRIVEPNWKEFYSDTDNVSDTFWKKCLRFRPLNIASSTHNTLFPLLVAICSVPSADGSILGKKSLFEQLTGLSFAQDDGMKDETIDVAPFLAYQFIYNENYRDSQIDTDLFNLPYQALWYLTPKGLYYYYDLCQKTLLESANITYINNLPSGLLTGTSTEILADLYDGILPLLSLPWADLALNSGVPNSLKFLASTTLKIVTNLFALRKRRWQRDRFTIARTQITNGDVPVVPVAFQTRPSSSVSLMTHPGDLYVNNSTDTSTVLANNSAADSVKVARAWNLGFTIGQLRLANALQKFEEKAVKFGLRYAEQLASHFGVIISDKTIQLPEYLGGCQSTAYVNEVTQTSESTPQSAQGNYAGHMMTAENGDTSSIFCEEHGYIFILTSCVAETAYSDGLPKMFQRGSDRLNFYSPEFAMLTDEEVKLKELYAIPDTQKTILAHNNDETFGYQGRFDEYRTRTNEFHGEFDDSLIYWHLGRKFSNIASLNWSIGFRDIQVLGDVHTAPFKGYVLTAALPTGNYVWYSDGVEMTSGYIYMVGDTFIEAGTNDAALQAIDSNLTGVLAAQPNVKVGMVPYQWVSNLGQMLNQNAGVYFNLTDAHKCYVTLPSNVMLGNVLVANSLVPQLNSSFIESSVSTRIFAETEDLENMVPVRLVDAKIIGDDYIYASFENELKVVRAMPESSEPKL